jgi:hypothetical protein
MTLVIIGRGQPASRNRRIVWSATTSLIVYRRLDPLPEASRPDGRSTSLRAQWSTMRTEAPANSATLAVENSMAVSRDPPSRRARRFVFTASAYYTKEMSGGSLEYIEVVSPGFSGLAYLTRCEIQPSLVPATMRRCVGRAVGSRPYIAKRTRGISHLLLVHLLLRGGATPWAA